MNEGAILNCIAYAISETGPYLARPPSPKALFSQPFRSINWISVASLNAVIS